MRTDLWNQFGDLAAPARRVLVTVQTHNADGTASVTTADGSAFRVRGPLDLTPTYNAWVVDDRILEAAPNFPIVEVTV